jgi:CRISPR-associated exonuclease Cas4
MNNEEPQARAPTPLATCDDELLLPISALNDLLFCERRAAMHLIEQVWQDNPHTLEGSYAHERADIPKDVVEHGVRAVHGVLLRSNRLRLVGKADVVEFHEMKNEERKMKNEQVEAGRQQNAVLPDSQPNLTSSLFVAHSSFFISSASTLVPYPVDYKRGRKRRWDNDDVQLCAQALCLSYQVQTAPRGRV